MPERNKRVVILELLEETNIPLRPMTVYGGLIYNSDITFTYRTVQNILSELSERGDVSRVTIDSENGVVRPVAADSSKRSYYLITDQGRQRLADERPE